MNSSSWQGPVGHWLKGHPYTAGAVLVLSVVALSFGRRQQSEWREVYVPAAARLWLGEDVYRPDGGYLYPPFMAWTVLPFLTLPDALGRGAWFLVNLICLLGLLRWSWRLAGGGRLEGVGAAKLAEHVAAVLGGLCGGFYIQNCLAHQQTDVVIGAALAGGCLLLMRGRVLLAATSFGLAAACKCTGLLWAPYLLWRGRPFAAAWLLAVALGVNLLPDFVSTSPSGQPWLEVYTSRFLKPLTDSEYLVGAWRSEPVYNQSLAGLGRRWFTTSWTWAPDDCTVELCTPRVSPLALRSGVYGLQMVLLLAVLWNCGRPFQRLSQGADGCRQGLECGVVLLLMVLLSPMSSKAHFGTLVLPGFCLARAAIASRSRLLASVLVGAVLLAVLSNKDPLGEKLYTLSLWYGVVTWQSLLLLAGCLIALPSNSPKTTTDYTDKDEKSLSLSVLSV